MIGKDQARNIVAALLADDHADRTGDSAVVVIDDLALQTDYGWFFPYSTARFARTRDPRHGLMGAGPILVLARDGSVVTFSSAYGLEDAAEAYEADPSKFRVRHVPAP